MNFLNIDPEILALIKQEEQRQDTTINLIASENYVHPLVQEVTGSILTNKYAEGYPSKRYYGGCEIVDKIEQLAIDRCKELFKFEHVNVQPHSGSQANIAVYFSILKPGDTIMGMNLSAGGHLTHGHDANVSGSWFNKVQYNVDPETELLDYNEIQKFAEQHKPKIIIAGASAYSRIIDFEKFAEIAKSTNAYLMADIAHIAGLIAADLHPSPVNFADFITSTTHKTLRGPRGGLIASKAQFKDQIDKSIMPGTQGGPLLHVIAAKAVAFKLAMEPEFKVYQKQVILNAQAMVEEFKNLQYRVVSGGTDNHLFILDLRSKNISGKEAESRLNKAGIVVSRSTIPYDPAKPWITSGIRIGTPAITTKGFKETDARAIAHLVDEVLSSNQFETKCNQFKDKACQIYSTIKNNIACL